MNLVCRPLHVRCDVMSHWGSSCAHVRMRWHIFCSDDRHCLFSSTPYTSSRHVNKETDRIPHYSYHQLCENWLSALLERAASDCLAKKSCCDSPSIRSILNETDAQSSMTSVTPSFLSLPMTGSHLPSPYLAPHSPFYTCSSDQLFLLRA